jgi:hypothetical protein
MLFSDIDACCFWILFPLFLKNGWYVFSFHLDSHLFYLRIYIYSGWSVTNRNGGDYGIRGPIDDRNCVVVLICDINSVRGWIHCDIEWNINRNSSSSNDGISGPVDD